MKILCNIALTHDAGEALDALLSRSAWETLSAIARESAGDSGGSTLGGAAMTEDEELSRALAASMEDQDPGRDSAPLSAPGSRATSSRRVAPAVLAAQARAAAQQDRAPATESRHIYTGSDDDDVVMISDDEDEQDEDEEDDGVYDDFQDADSDMDDDPKPLSFANPGFSRNQPSSGGAGPSNSSLQSNNPPAPQPQQRAPAPAPAPADPAPIQQPPPQVQHQNPIAATVDDEEEEAATVQCPHCTFGNPIGSQDCEICGLPM